MKDDNLPTKNNSFKPQVQVTLDSQNKSAISKKTQFLKGLDHPFLGKCLQIIVKESKLLLLFEEVPFKLESQIWLGKREARLHSLKQKLLNLAVYFSKKAVITQFHKSNIGLTDNFQLKYFQDLRFEIGNSELQSSHYSKQIESVFLNLYEEKQKAQEFNIDGLMIYHPENFPQPTNLYRAHLTKSSQNKSYKAEALLQQISQKKNKNCNKTLNTERITVSCQEEKPSPLYKSIMHNSMMSPIFAKTNRERKPRKTDIQPSCLEEFTSIQDRGIKAESQENSTQADFPQIQSTFISSEKSVPEWTANTHFTKKVSNSIRNSQQVLSKIKSRRDNNQ